MSKATDFLAHLGESPQSSAQLEEASGEDSKTVSNRLQVLKGMGAAKRTADGWVKVIKSNGSHAPINETAAPPPKKKKKRAAERVARKPGEEEAMLSFFLDDDFDLQVCRKDGTGESAIIPRQEALRLRDFLNQVGDIMRLP